MGTHRTDGEGPARQLPADRGTEPMAGPGGPDGRPQRPGPAAQNGPGGRQDTAAGEY